MNDENILDQITTLSPESTEETKALVNLGRYVADRGYRRLRENAIDNCPEFEREGFPEDALPTDLWLSERRDKTENDLILDAITASGRGYWDDDPGGPFFWVTVERRSGTDRRRSDAKLDREDRH